MAKTNRRQHGEGSIYQRADGRWVTEIHLGYKPDGRPDRRYLYGKTPEEVQAKKTKFHASREAGFVPPKGKGDTVGQWMSRWLHTIIKPTVRETTWNKSYRSKVEDHIIPRLGRGRLKDLTEENVEEFEAYLLTAAPLGAGLSPSTVLQIHRILSKALKEATRRRMIPRNPCEFVTPPTVDRDEPLPPERDEAALIMEAATGMRNGVRWALNLAVGPRQGEALGLLWPYIDLEDLDNATIEIAWELVRLPWQHGCADPHACGAKRHRYPCPPDPKDCSKAQRTSGRRHRCRTACPARCKEHEGKCVKFCPPDCRMHATSCPQRRGGGLVLTEPKSRKSRRTIAIPRQLAEMFRAQRQAQREERMANRPIWTGWQHSCDRRPRAREVVCPKCRLPFRDNLLVFAQPDGSPVDPRRDWQEWADLLAELGLPHYRIHDGRHFSATIQLEEGVDIRTVQENHGHATPAFTQATYQHVTPRLRKDAASKIGDALWG